MTSTSGLFMFMENVFADSAAIMLVITGIMMLVWFFYEGVRRGFVKPKNESWERDNVSRILKIIILLGIILGVIVVVTGIMTIFLRLPPSYAYRDRYSDLAKYRGFDLLTSVSLILLGLAMFLKPLEDVPVATFLAVIVAGLLGFLAIMFVPEAILQYKAMKYIIGAVCLLTGTMIAVLSKVWIDGVEFIAKVLSWPPFAMILATYCLVQGFMLWITGYTIILI